MYTSLQKVKRRLGLDKAGFDELITGLIKSMSAYINTTISTELTADDHIDYYNPVNKVILRYAPVNSVTEVRLVNSDIVLTENEDYYVDKRLGIVDLSRRDMINYPKDVKITYNAGYTVDYDEFGEPVDSDNLPHDLRELCEVLVTRKFKKRESEGKTSESFNNSQINWARGMDKDEKMIIRAYSRRRHSH